MFQRVAQKVPPRWINKTMQLVAIVAIDWGDESTGLSKRASANVLLCWCVAIGCYGMTLTATSINTSVRSSRDCLLSNRVTSKSQNHNLRSLLTLQPPPPLAYLLHPMPKRENSRQSLKDPIALVKMAGVAGKPYFASRSHSIPIKYHVSALPPISSP